MEPLPFLGHGIGLRREHYGHLLREPPDGVDWFEVVTENFFEPGGRPWAVLERVRAARPVALHGVALGIGNVAPLDERYLDALAGVAQRIEPAWISDHLCWGGLDGRYAHDLLPLPYTEEALAHVVARVTEVQERLGRVLLLENVSSYVAFVDSAMPEHEFLNEVARRSGCGILLDLNNVVVSAHNHGQDPRTYVDSLDAARVGQIHLAGHSDHGDHLLDSHQGPVPEVVWSLYRHVLPRLGGVSTLVEWDTSTPAFPLVAEEARRARAVAAEHRALRPTAEAPRA